MLSNLNSSTRHDENSKRVKHSIRVSPIVTKVAQLEIPDAMAALKTSSADLTQDEAQARLLEYGPNVVAAEKQRGWLWRLFTAARNLLVLLLATLATISFITGDYRAGTVILLMVVLGVALRFVQESRADSAAAKLKAMISVTAAVMRDGSTKEIELKHLVPGDIVHLCAGDMIPADVRLISSKDLFVAQAALTGESLPVEKFEFHETRADIQPLELANICFLGTSVESGSATAVVVATCDPDEKNPFYSGSRELAAQRHNSHCHVHWYLVALFATRLSVRIRASPASVLANTCSHPDLLHDAHSGRKNVADTQNLVVNKPRFYVAPADERSPRSKKMWCQRPRPQPLDGQRAREDARFTILVCHKNIAIRGVVTT
jgi:hypothetical protein